MRFNTCNTTCQPNARIITDNAGTLDYFGGIGTASVQENSNYVTKYCEVSRNANVHRQPET